MDELDGLSMHSEFSSRKPGVIGSADVYCVVGFGVSSCHLRWIICLSVGVTNISVKLSYRLARVDFGNNFIRNDGRIPPPPSTKEQACAGRTYPRGSIGEAWQKWIRMKPWRDLADSTRQKQWWPAWTHRIEPIFGDVAPDTVTLDVICDWYERIEVISGLTVAHATLKVWRAFCGPAQRLADNSYAEVHARRSHAACEGCVALQLQGPCLHHHVCWDTGFSPKDSRTLRAKHMITDPVTGRIVFDRTAQGRAKIGVAVIGTMSKFGDWLVRRYLAETGVEHAPESILFRTKRGLAYGESRIGVDFAEVRRATAPGDKRQVRDMRRSGVMEAFTGNATPRDVAEKFGNTIDRSNTLFKTYNPVDLEKVRQIDEARLEGRRKRNAPVKKSKGT